jgi:hypothetical protein
MQGDWKTLCSKFCLGFFPIYSVISLWKEVLNFRQLEEESLVVSWDHFNDLIILARTLPSKTQYFFNIFIWVLIRIPCNPLIKPLEELSFICLLVKQGLCLIELVERLLALAFIMNYPRFSYQPRTINNPESKSSKRRNSAF